MSLKSLSFGEINSNSKQKRYCSQPHHHVNYKPRDQTKVRYAFQMTKLSASTYYFHPGLWSNFGSEGDRVRVQPNQDDTLHVESVLSKRLHLYHGRFKQTTARWGNRQNREMGDKQTITQSWKIIQLMQLHELAAVNTLFEEPSCTSTLHIFLQTKHKEDGSDDLVEANMLSQQWERALETNGTKGQGQGQLC